MQAKIETLKAKNANDEEYLVYPRTLVKCVVDENGNNLEDKLTEFVEAEFGDTFATKTYVAEEIANAGHLKREIVTEIPTAENAEENIIYMYKVDGASGNDVYQEYQLINGVVEMIGDTSVDLSGYAEIVKIEDGSILAGNAKTLEGHRASYFAPLTMLAGQRMPTGTDLNDCVDIGTYYFDSLATNYVNVPSIIAHNGIMNVRKYDNNRIVQEYFSVNTGVMYTRTGTASNWKLWREVFTANGGTIDGRITLTASDNQPVFEINNSESQGWLIANGIYLGFYNNKAQGWVWTSSASGANEFRGTATGNLPLNGGGTVTSNADTPIIVKTVNTNHNEVYVGYTAVDKWSRFMGFKDGEPYVYNKGAIFYTGNKPTGTYTGNGDATQRTINTGGIGSAVAIYSASGGIMAIVTAGGAITSSAGSMQGISVNEAGFLDGVLTLATSSQRFNANGVVYTYQVL